MVNTNVLWTCCIGNSARCAISTNQTSSPLLAIPSVCTHRKFITIKAIIYRRNAHVSKKHVFELGLLVFGKTQQ